MQKGIEMVLTELDKKRQSLTHGKVPSTQLPAHLDLTKLIMFIGGRQFRLSGVDSDTRRCCKNTAEKNGVEPRSAIAGAIPA